MTAATVEQVLEEIYTSLNNENENLDTHIDQLKVAMGVGGLKKATVDAKRLPHPNREGRKIMQSYFRKRGVAIDFTGQ
jgi:hypothetical protein